MIKLLSVFLLSFLAHDICAGEWFVRPPGGSYGSGDGSSYTDAWSGFKSIDWGQLGAGDVLYITGEFSGESLLVYGGGDAAADLSIRGDHSSSRGIIRNASISLRGKDASYITFYGLEIEGGRIAAGDIAYYGAANVEFIAPNKLRDYDRNLISRGFVEGLYILPRSGTGNNRFAYLIKSSVSQPGYDEITIDTDKGTFQFVNEGPGAKNLSGFHEHHHITVDNSIIRAGGANVELVDASRITDLTIKNSELDGRDSDMDGLLYVQARNYYRAVSNLTIENNYLHGAGSYSSEAYDSHCIGLQSADNLLITKNRISNCAAGIVFWHDPDRGLKNWEVSYNLIEGMDYAKHSAQFGGGGIVISGADEGPNNTSGLVAHNIIDGAKNWPANESWSGLGISSKMAVSTRIWNNVIIGANYGLYLARATAPDVKNNVVLNSNIHIYSPIDPTGYKENYQIYYPGGLKFKRRTASALDFKDYNNALGGGVNSFSIVTSPALDAQYRPVASSSSLVGAGVDVGLPYLKDVKWPSGPGGGVFVFADDHGSPEIGAFSFDGDELSGDAVVKAMSPPAAPIALSATIDFL